MPVMATKLQELREQKGLTRKDVSVATGIPYNSLKRLELRTSEHLVNVTHLKTLARYYDQPLDLQHLLGV